MSRESVAETKQCAYCAAFSNKLEHDHIPPRSIFAKPSAFITVPACTACHRATTKDDEYFRLMLAMRHDLHEHPDVSGGVLDSVLRSLTYPRAARFSQSFKVHKTLRVTPAMQAGIADRVFDVTDLVELIEQAEAPVPA